MGRVPARVLLALALCALWGCATSKSSGRQPTAEPVIDEVEIEGTDELDDSDIKKKILTSEPGFWSFLPDWVPFAPDRPRFEPNAWQADLRRVERYYQAHGYYSARVTNDSADFSRPGHVRLQLAVEEGKPTFLREIGMTGLESLSAALQKKVLDELPLSVGDIFLEENWTGVKTVIQHRLREAGYAEATVRGEVNVDIDKHEARVVLEAQLGRRYKFGRIFPANPEGKVGIHRIVETVEGAIKPGAWYTESALVEAQNRVFQMGVFGGVKVNPGAPDREEGTVPVVVDVREAPFHSLRAGGGFGLDQTRWEARGLFEYTNRNFFGNLRRFTTRGRLGYAALPNPIAVAQRNQNSKHGPIGDLTLELEQPRFLHRNLTFQTSVQPQAGIEPAYDFIGASTKVGIIWRPRSDVALFPSLNFDAFRLSTPSPLQGRSPAVTFGCALDCLVGYFDVTAEWDRRDDRNEPRQGFYVSASAQVGGWPQPPRLGLSAQEQPKGLATYVRLMPDIRGYYSPDEKKRLTFASRLRLGTILAEAPAPIIARFFSGGAMAMRGFNTRRLSPQLAVPRDRTPDGLATDIGQRQGETQPVGGNGLVEATMEVRYNAFGNFVFALFADVGLVATEQLRLRPDYYLTHLLYAVGAGVRLRTPFGPIRIDLATRLPFGNPLEVEQPGDPNRTSGPAGPRVSYPVANQCFLFPANNHQGDVRSPQDAYPGSPENLCAFHLSIGEAF